MIILQVVISPLTKRINAWGQHIFGALCLPISVHEKWSFPLQIFSVNVTKSAVFLRIWSYLLKKSIMENFINLQWKTALGKILCRLCSEEKRCSPFKTTPLTHCCIWSLGSCCRRLYGTSASYKLRKIICFHCWWPLYQVWWSRCLVVNWNHINYLNVLVQSCIQTRPSPLILNRSWNKR